MLSENKKRKKNTKKSVVPFAKGFKHPTEQQRMECVGEEELNPLYSFSKKLPKVPTPSHVDDWLAQWNEDLQTFPKYERLRVDPVKAFYIQPIGEFQENVLSVVGEYCCLFFGMTVKVLDPINFVFDEKKNGWKLRCFLRGRKDQEFYLNIPTRNCHPYDVDKTSKDHVQFGAESLLTCLQSVRSIQKEGDACRVIGLTMEDLFQGRSDSFVVGLAGPGVCCSSLHRYLPCNSSDLCLRMSRVAVHELSHCLGIAHCILTPCVMNGSGRVEEDINQPLYLCPCDLKKVCWKLQIDPVERYMSIKEFTSKQGWKEIEDYVTERLKLVEK